jgi:hypothetical protein
MRVVLVEADHDEFGVNSWAADKCEYATRTCSAMRKCAVLC